MRFRVKISAGQMSVEVMRLAILTSKIAVRARKDVTSSPMLRLTKHRDGRNGPSGS
jgi:hypothetical protein